MEKSMSYSDYRSQLLQKALEEKKKLGLGGGHASNVRHSSALQALQCYGLEPNDVTLCEAEETVCRSHTTERREIIELPKQTISCTEQQSLTSNSFSCSSPKDGKRLKSILKKATGTLNSVPAGIKHSPYSSNINTPFFLNNAENEDEFLYGKSINEQSLRVSALYASAKYSKTHTNYFSSNKNKDTTNDLFAQNSKTSCLSGDSKTLSSEDLRASTDLCDNSKNKSSVVRSTVQNLETSSNLSGYAALLNFSKTGHTGDLPRIKNISGSGSSQKKCETFGDYKTNSPGAAHDNLTCGGLYCPNSLKSPTTSSVVDKNRSENSLVSVNKQVPNLLPRSIQKLQMKKMGDQPFDKKTASFETVTEKALDNETLHDSSHSDLSKSSEKKKSDVKPNKGGPSLKNDELLLLKYAQGSRNFYRGRSKSDQASKLIPDSVTNSDCKPGVENLGSIDVKRKCDDIVVSVTCTESTKPGINNVSAMEITGDSLELTNKSGLCIESELSNIQPDLKPFAHVEIPPNSKGNAVSETCMKEIGFSNRKKELLRKLSSMKKKKKKNFFHQEKNSFRKELISKRGPRSVFVRGEVYGRISHRGRYSRLKHSCYFSSEKTADAERGKQKSENYSLSPETNVCDRSINSEIDIGSHNSRDHVNETNPVFQKSSEFLSYDNSLTSSPAKSVRKYDVSPERLSSVVGVTDFTKQGRHENVNGSSPKRHSLYSGHGHDISVRNALRHSLDWSPPRNELDNNSRRHSMDLTLERYSFDASPRIWRHLDRSPSRQSFNESCGIHPFDKSSSPCPFSRSPSPYSHDRNPSVPPFRMADSHSFNNQSPDLDPYDNVSHDSHSYVWSADAHSQCRKQDSYLYDRSPDYNSHSRNSDPLSCGGSLRSGSCARSPSPNYYGGSRDSRSRNRRLKHHHSYDGSPGPESCDRSSRMHSQEMSVKKHTFRKGHRPHSCNSPTRNSVEMNPRRLSKERDPVKVSNNASQKKLSQDRSSRKFSGNESCGMHSIELSPRRLSSERGPRNKSFGVSPNRFQKSRIGSCHGSPDRMYCRSPCKESCENLKHPHCRSPETVIFDSRKRFSERTPESNHGDLNQNSSSGNAMFEEESNRCVEKQNPSSLFGISQHQKQKNTLDKNFVIPDVNKIVNAIDALVSNYYKTVANDKTHGITQGCSSQVFDSTLNARNPVQLNTASVTYVAAYDQSCYSHTSNNLQLTYNSEVPKVSYPPYSASPVDSYLPNCTPLSLSSQLSDNTTRYQTSASEFRSAPTASPYRNTGVAAKDSVQAQFSITNQQCGNGFMSSTFCDGIAVSPVQKPCTAIDELSELYPANESNYGAGGDLLERVTTLTAIPLQSNVLTDEFSKKNSSKSQSNISSAVTMKFITPEKIEKLLRQKSEIRKHIGCLNDEFEKLLKMQGDALRKKRREKDGHKDLLLQEYSRLQDEIKNQLNNLVGDMKNIEQELKNGFLGCTSDKAARKEHIMALDNRKEPKKSGECTEHTEDPSYYEFYDSGSHWCKYCDKLCTTVTGMLEHVKSDGHLELISQIEKPWCSIPTIEKPIVKEQKGQKITKPIKGIQFVMPVEGFYCSLCKEYFENITHMQEHLKSLKHFEIYQNYTAENPTYERQWLMERLASLSHIEVEDNKIASMEDKPLQKKGRKEEEARLREKGERFQYETERLGQNKETVERIMDVKETKKKHNAREEEHKEDENFGLKVGVMEKLKCRKEEKQSSKNITEHKRGIKYAEEEEEKLSNGKQDTLKRKKDEQNETNKKIKILNSVHETEHSSEKLENTADTDLPVEKQSVPGAKWTVCSQQKKLSLSKSSESKNKPKQTVVYIGRAPNFRSHNKGNSSFRENLLKLALQKKEAAVNSNSVMTSPASSINSNASLPVLASTLPETVKHSYSSQDGLTDTIGSDVANTCNPLSNVCAVITHSQPSSENVKNGNGLQINSSLGTLSTPEGNNTRSTNSKNRHYQSSSENARNSSGLQGNCSVKVLSTPKGNNWRSANDPDSSHGSLTCAPNQQSTSTSGTVRSDFVPNFENCDMAAAVITHVGTPVCNKMSNSSYANLSHSQDQMLSANVSLSTPDENILSNVTCGGRSDHSNLPVKPGLRKSPQGHNKKSDTVQGPLTEEEDDYRLLGINREDRLPLVLPKPPPASLIWSCPKDEANAPDERLCDNVASVTSDSNASKNWLISGGTDSVPALNSGASHLADVQEVPATSTAQIVKNSGNLLASHQSFMYGVNITQGQSVNYSANVQTKFPPPFGSVNCTNTSSMHHTHTYPYNSNMGNLTPFQENFVVPDKNNMPCFAGAQISPPMRFQNLARQGKYVCRQALPPECYNQKSINFYAGRYPQNQFPPPSVNLHQNYSPMFQRNFGPLIQMPRRLFKNKQWHIQRKMKNEQDVDKKEKPVSPKQEVLSQVKTEQVLHSTENEKLVSCKIAHVDGCAVDSISEAGVLKRDYSFATSSSEKGDVERVNILGVVENAQKSLPAESGGDVSNCGKKCTNVSAVDSEISDNQASVHSIKRKILSVAETNDSEQVSTSEATAVGTQDTATTFMIPVNNLCENTVGGTNVKTVQGTSQENDLCELKICEGTQHLESEKHHTSISDKSQ